MENSSCEIKNLFSSSEFDTKSEGGKKLSLFIGVFLTTVVFSYLLFNSTISRYGFRDAEIENKLNEANVANLLLENNIQSIDNYYNGLGGYIDVKSNDRTYTCDGFNFRNSYKLELVGDKVEYRGADLIKRGVSFQSLLDSINLNLKCIKTVKNDDIIKNKNRNTWKIGK